tara:strand:- start:57 stop:305 length:249 start_codon:yes stop_codon:yes gene_type:complete
MTNQPQNFTGRVHIVERLKNSRNGNSRFLALCVSDGETVTFQTRADCSTVICLQNLNNKRATVSLKQNKRGRWVLQDINAAE